MTRIKLPTGFSSRHWVLLEHYYREKIDEGCLNWELDLTQLELIRSPMLGLVIGFNTILETRNGKLRVIVRKHSPVAQVLNISKVNLILDIHEVD
ncbi:hypothetical protein LLG95_14120 [bacterium]|nr:hypothetical protein [bacterium]